MRFRSCPAAPIRTCNNRWWSSWCVCERCAKSKFMYYQQGKKNVLAYAVHAHVPLDNWDIDHRDKRASSHILFVTYAGYYFVFVFLHRSTVTLPLVSVNMWAFWCCTFLYDRKRREQAAEASFISGCYGIFFILSDSTDISIFFLINLVFLLSHQKHNSDWAVF